MHVGVGGRGRHWLDFVKTRDDAVSSVCVDVDEDALAEVREQFGCETFTSLEEALAASTVDGAIIASPSFLHGEQSAKVLGAGIPVMVEKPLAGNLSDAVDVVEAARIAGKVLMVAENYRFFPAERTLRSFIAEGKPGKIIAATCVDRRDQPTDSQGPWVQSMEQPFLTEIAVHHFDSFRYLFGCQPDSIWARTYNPEGSDYAENASAETLLEMQDGLNIQYSGSFLGSRYEYDLHIEAEHGELRTDRVRVWWRPWNESSFRQVDAVPMPEGESARYPDAGMVSMLAQFAEAILHGKQPETSGADNLWTLAMFEAAVRSAKTGECVSIEDVFTPAMQKRANTVLTSAAN